MHLTRAHFDLAVFPSLLAPRCSPVTSGWGVFEAKLSALPTGLLNIEEMWKVNNIFAPSKQMIDLLPEKPRIAMLYSPLFCIPLQVKNNVKTPLIECIFDKIDF